MTKLILSGYGGQGMLLCGQLLSYASMLDGRQVTWVPAYGAEVRGGAAYCYVVISDKPVGNPVIDVADILVVCSQPSLDKFHSAVAAGGRVVYHSAIVGNVPKRADLSYIGVDFSTMANTINFPRAANMIVLGLLAGLVGARRDYISEALRYRLSSAPANVIEANEKAIDLGIAEAESILG